MLHPSIRASWLVVPVVLFACVGDTPTTTGDAGPPQGTEGGACFPNGTCNAGLTCVIPNRCEKPGSDGGASDGEGGTPTDASPDAPSSCALIAWWRAEGNANDVKGAFHLTWFGGPDYQGGAFNLTGTNYLTNTKVLSTPAITVEATVKPLGITNGTIFATDDLNTTNKGVWFGIKQSKLSARINKLTCTGTGPLAASISRHVAFTFGNGQCAFYLDGNLDGQVQTITAAAIADELGPQVGANANAASYTDYFSGTIDELAVWRGVLSGPEISALAKENPAVKCQ